jgi:hypothetical protein
VSLKTVSTQPGKVLSTGLTIPGFFRRLDRPSPKISMAVHKQTGHKIVIGANDSEERAACRLARLSVRRHILDSRPVLPRASVRYYNCRSGLSRPL